MAAIPKFLRNFGFPLHSRGNTGVNEVIFVSKSPGGQWPPLCVFCQFFEFCNRPIFKLYAFLLICNIWKISCNIFYWIREEAMVI